MHCVFISDPFKELEEFDPLLMSVCGNRVCDRGESASGCLGVCWNVEGLFAWLSAASVAPASPWMPKLPIVM